MRRRLPPVPYPFAEAKAPPNPFDDADEYMAGWWAGYHTGIDTGRWRGEVDRLTRWQRWRFIRMCIRSLDRRRA